MTIRDQIHPAEKKWFAVQCKFRCEKSLVTDLTASNIEAYVPIQKKIRQYASRKKYSEVALIPSHIFVKIDRSEYIEILQHVHVFRFLHFSGVLCSIPQAEMDLMRRVVGEVDDVRITSARFSVGDRVHVINGELTGLQGRLIAENNHNFKIELESLGMGLMIYVDPKKLMKIGSQELAKAV